MAGSIELAENELKPSNDRSIKQISLSYLFFFVIFAALSMAAAAASNVLLRLLGLLFSERERERERK